MIAAHPRIYSTFPAAFPPKNPASITAINPIPSKHFDNASTPYLPCKNRIILSFIDFNLAFL